MASSPHRYHPDPEREDDPEAILFDDCDGCRENAEAPLEHLDAQNLRRVQNRIKCVAENEETFRSNNEILACGIVYEKFRDVFGENVVIDWPIRSIDDAP